MIVTIDGPAGAGKSSVARALAARLGFRFLDTGAMYRAIAYAALEQGLDLTDADQLARLVKSSRLELRDHAVLLDGQDVTHAIRSPEVTQAVRHVADNLQVRAHLSVLQRRLAVGGDIVTEGRDQGTVVFPDAACKVFLTASPEVRARRRQAEMRARGIDLTLEDVLQQQNDRDRQDADRPVGRLEAAEDAVEICTNELAPEEVLDRIEQLVRSRMPGRN